MLKNYSSHLQTFKNNWFLFLFSTVGYFMFFFFVKSVLELKFHVNFWTLVYLWVLNFKKRFFKCKQNAVIKFVIDSALKKLVSLKINRYFKSKTIFVLTVAIGRFKYFFSLNKKVTFWVGEIKLCVSFELTREGIPCTRFDC